jgi:hypothetical protein
VLWKRESLWRKLSHENILPFRGVDMSLIPPSLVYDWAENGKITTYIALHPDVPRGPLVCKPLSLRKQEMFTNFVFFTPDGQLLGVAKGLKYLHELDIPHGRLKGVGSLPISFISISFPSALNCAIVFISW